MVRLDLQNIYDVNAVNDNGNELIAEFDAPQTNGGLIHIHVKLSLHPDPFLSKVYNLCLGPVDETGSIDDKIRLKHQDVSKVLSTAIFVAYYFLNDRQDSVIGLDGSDDIRANLYHSMFILNRELMSDFFVCVGVDWYVKLLRNKIDVERDDQGNPLFKPIIEPFDYLRDRKQLYGYYMFSLK
ncbi:DUF6934 family protein [Pedobacter zeae]|uniref:Uncharacterized protein n=1 Tax=Pedobacter zeae TaxID=1737356 RepID=A0A7W6KB36_9SPHI|nr:hypothetical protein [Pedobacter zeae]MBB4108525.1 hypothetical protein [Pedobacter zeae]GGG92254.1 hypothetical protein GCM10007422_01580 [Pedobacter zeae]